MKTPITINAHGRRIEFQMDLDPDFPADRWILGAIQNHVCYEAEVAWALIHSLEEGDIAIDAGANVGFFTLLMSRLVGKTGKVLAFEPDHVNIRKLRANLELNEIKNVQGSPQPLTDKPGPVKFYRSADDSGGSALWNPAHWKDNNLSRRFPEEPYAVEATTLDQAVPYDEFGPVKLIKLDIEGAELLALKGGADMLHGVRHIVCEINPFALDMMRTDEPSLRHFLSLYGKKMFVLHGDGTLPAMLPKETMLGAQHIVNVLFSTIGAVGEAWKEAYR